MQNRRFKICLPGVGEKWVDEKGVCYDNASTKIPTEELIYRHFKDFFRVRYKQLSDTKLEEVKEQEEYIEWPGWTKNYNEQKETGVDKGYDEPRGVEEVVEYGENGENGEILSIKPLYNEFAFKHFFLCLDEVLRKVDLSELASKVDLHQHFPRTARMLTDSERKVRIEARKLYKEAQIVRQKKGTTGQGKSGTTPTIKGTNGNSLQKASVRTMTGNLENLKRLIEDLSKDFEVEENGSKRNLTDEEKKALAAKALGLDGQDEEDKENDEQVRKQLTRILNVNGDKGLFEQAEKLGLVTGKFDKKYSSEELSRVFSDKELVNTLNLASNPFGVDDSSVEDEEEDVSISFLCQPEPKSNKKKKKGGPSDFAQQIQSALEDSLSDASKSLIHLPIQTSDGKWAYYAIDASNREELRIFAFQGEDKGLDQDVVDAINKAFNLKNDDKIETKSFKRVTNISKQSAYINQGATLCDVMEQVQAIFNGDDVGEENSLGEDAQEVGRQVKEQLSEVDSNGNKELKKASKIRAERAEELVGELAEDNTGLKSFLDQDDIANDLKEKAKGLIEDAQEEQKTKEAQAKKSKHKQELIDALINGGFKPGSDENKANFENFNALKDELLKKADDEIDDNDIAALGELTRVVNALNGNGQGKKELKEKLFEDAGIKAEVIKEANKELENYTRSTSQQVSREEAARKAIDDAKRNHPNLSKIIAATKMRSSRKVEEYQSEKAQKGFLGADVAHEMSEDVTVLMEALAGAEKQIPSGLLSASYRLYQTSSFPEFIHQMNQGFFSEKTAVSRAYKDVANAFNEHWDFWSEDKSKVFDPQKAVRAALEVAQARMKQAYDSDDKLSLSILVNNLTSLRDDTGFIAFAVEAKKVKENIKQHEELKKTYEKTVGQLEKFTNSKRFKKAVEQEAKHTAKIKTLQAQRAEVTVQLNKLKESNQGIESKYEEQLNALREVQANLEEAIALRKKARKNLYNRMYSTKKIAGLSTAGGVFFAVGVLAVIGATGGLGAIPIAAGYAIAVIGGFFSLTALYMGIKNAFKGASIAYLMGKGMKQYLSEGTGKGEVLKTEYKLDRLREKALQSERKLKQNDAKLSQKELKEAKEIAKHEAKLAKHEGLTNSVETLRSAVAELRETTGKIRVEVAKLDDIDPRNISETTLSADQKVALYSAVVDHFGSQRIDGKNNNYMLRSIEFSGDNDLLVGFVNSQPQLLSLKSEDGKKIINTANKALEAKRDKLAVIRGANEFITGGVSDVGEEESADLEVFQRALAEALGGNRGRQL